MVSSLLVDAIANPTQALRDLHDELNDHDAFFDKVSPHFSEIFATENAMAEIPLLDLHHPPEKHGAGALIQFTAMIQDNSISPEVYLSKLSNGNFGGWGIVDKNHGHNVDYADLRECSVLWAVSIPGQEHNTEGIQLPQISQGHKYPIPGAKHIGVKVKIYDAHGESFRATDIVTFVGILSSEPNHTDIDGSTSTIVPTLHVLFSRAPTAPAPSSIDIGLRSEIISWIAEEGLAGDELAAEWIFLSCLAQVQSRTPPITPKTLCLSRFPCPDDNSCMLPSLARVLALLFPYVTTVPLSLETINTTPFSPEFKNEDLHSGWLQLPKGSLCLVTENGVKEGTVNENGIMNLRRMQDMMTAQTLEYVFPYSTFSFETDVNFVVICEGSKSAFFQNNVVHPLQSGLDKNELYKTASQVAIPEKLDEFRRFIVNVKASSVSISDDAAKYIQEDFVQERKDNTGITADDFIHRMNIARLVTLSYGEADISKDMWEKTKILDAERMQRTA